MKIGFIGTGKMATAIARGALDHGVLHKDEVYGMDISATARAAFASAIKVESTFEDVRKMVDVVDAVVIAVKPQMAQTALEPVIDLCGEKLIISIAAGLPLQTISGWLKTRRVIRVMSNTPAMAGKGASAFCCGAGVKAEDRSKVIEILEAVGTALEVVEKQMDAITALSGSGPAYIFEMVLALSNAGAACGLPAGMAAELAVQTLVGAAEMLARKSGTPEELRDAVTTPGGTTEAGLKKLRENQFEKVICAAVKAARDRSIELSGK